MIKRILFETRTGELLLAFLEHKVGLAVVDAEWLGLLRSGELTAVTEVH